MSRPLILPKPVSPLEMLLGPSGAEARANEVTQGLLNELPGPVSHHVKRMSTLRLLSAEPSLTLMPFQLQVD